MIHYGQHDHPEGTEEALGEAGVQEVARVVEIVAPAGGALNRFKLNDRKLNHG